MISQASGRAMQFCYVLSS